LQTIYGATSPCFLCRPYGATFPCFLCRPHGATFCCFLCSSNILSLSMPMAFIPLAYFFCACFADDMVPHVLALQTIWYHMFAIFISAILLAYFFCACFTDDMVPHVCHTHLHYTIGIFFLCFALQTIWYHMFAILISAILLAYFFCACFADDMVPHVCHPHLRYTTGIFFLCLLCRRYGTTCLPSSSPLYYWHIFPVLALQTIWYHMFAILISAILLAYFFFACFADDMVPHVCHTHLRCTTGNWSPLQTRSTADFWVAAPASHWSLAIYVSSLVDNPHHRSKSAQTEEPDRCPTAFA